MSHAATSRAPNVRRPDRSADACRALALRCCIGSRIPLPCRLSVAVGLVSRAQIKSNSVALTPLNLLRRNEENNTARKLYSGLPTLLQSDAPRCAAGDGGLCALRASPI